MQCKELSCIKPQCLEIPYLVYNTLRGPLLKMFKVCLLVPNWPRARGDTFTVKYILN